MNHRLPEKNIILSQFGYKCINQMNRRLPEKTSFEMEDAMEGNVHTTWWLGGNIPI